MMTNPAGSLWVSDKVRGVCPVGARLVEFSYCPAFAVRFCCNALPLVELTSSSNEMLVVFQSNASGSGVGTSQRRGFQLAYRVGQHDYSRNLL